MIRQDRHSIRTTSSGIWILLLALVALLGSSSSAQAQNCSQFGGVLDGFAGDVPPAQMQIDQNCTIRNFPASNPLTTNFSFYQPNSNSGPWLVVFDNVVHTGNMACNSVAEHKIWFTNGSSTKIQEGCQNLLIPVEKIDKQNPAGTTTVAIGVPFTYTLTEPVLYDPATGTVINSSGSLNDLHSVTITDDLNATGVDLTYVSHTAYIQSTGAPVPHTFTNVGGFLTFDNFVFNGLPYIPAGEQIVIEITVVLEDTNTVGTSFFNTAKWEFGRLIDGVFYEPLPGEWGISEPLTIAEPSLTLTKTGPATLGLTLNLGVWGQFGLDVQNVGFTDAWNVTILDQLPDGATGGMCDTVPEVLTAQVFAADGTTPVSAPLVQGTDFSISYAGAPTCELTLTMLTAEAMIAPTERLIITYRTKLDADSQDGATLTNIAGTTEWFNGPPGAPNRLVYTDSPSDGTVGMLDNEDAHTVTVALFGYFYEKSVGNLTSGISPSGIASPGDVLRYTLRLQATDVPLDNLTFYDDMGALNALPVFVPGSLTLVPGSIPPGADTSNTNPLGGTNGAGILDVRNLNVPINSQIQIQFDITIDPGLADGTVLLNQADLIRLGIDIADSDDPNINGQADPNVVGDEDPTRVVIASLPVGPLVKQNTQATATIGEAFTYQITVPQTPYPFDLHDVQITDDLTASAADLRFLGATLIAGSQPWVLTNTGTSKNVVLEDTTTGIDIPANEQITIEITVVLEDTPTNVAGLPFTNTASWSRTTIDDDPTSRESGEPGTTAPMTIVEPDFTVTKNGPASMTVGTPGTYTVDLHNTGTSTAWNPTLTDRLPDTATGGTCDVAPTILTAQVFQVDGTTPVSAPLVQGVDYTVGFTGTPTCELTVSIVSAAGAVGVDERLIVTYDVSLDVDSQDAAVLTNVAGATEWFSTDGTNPLTVGDRRTYTEVLTDGTPAIPDHEDPHTFTVALPGYLFEKTVMNVTTNTNPATSAQPGELLRYTITIVNQSTNPLLDLSVFDEIGSLNPAVVFVPGSMQLVSWPAGADISNTNVNGGADGTGILDVRAIDLPNQNDTAVIVFEVQLAGVIANGTLVTNQSQLLIGGLAFALSDDPNVNGQADPFVPGDEDPTQVPIVSMPVFQVQKVSADLTGDPAVLLAGETLRYTITVKNVGTSDAVDAMLRDAVPANTQYVPGSTTLNGAPVPDGAGGTSPLVNGILINAPPPESQTPGAMRADSSATTANVATIVFDVVVDPNAIDGTIISNQAFVSAPLGGAPDQPSDDPATPIADDPTRDIVGSTPLLFAEKSAALLSDGGSPGLVDPGDTLRYTITVYNTGSVPATGATLTDNVPVNTTYLQDTLTLNGQPVGQPDNGVSPLIAGIGISTSDLTPPVPGPAGGTLTPGQSAVIQFDVVVNLVPPGTIISNQAVVATAETPDLPTDGDGNPATGPEPTIVVVGDGQQLSITKQVVVVGGGPALPGSVLEYSVTVTNVASVPAIDVLITDDLDAPVPGQLIYVASSATMNGATAGVSVVGPVITGDYGGAYGPLAAGATVVLRFRAVIEPTLPIGTTITNIGLVTWNAATQNANASVSIDVGGVPGVGVLSGAAWHDADFDDTQGGAELALAGWTVELWRGGQLLQSTQTDAAGAYSFGGVAPSQSPTDTYELRFTSPGAGGTTASLGTASSPYTNGPQQITGITVASGANLQNLDLPIDPDGVVYDAVTRVPLAGATLTLSATGGGALPPSCFDDQAQQGQVTLANGYYKFDLNFSDGACPSDIDYLISVAVPSAAYVAGASQLVPPTTDGTTAAFLVPSCPGTGSDAIPATNQHCEAQASEFAPPTSVPAGAGTTYYLNLRLDSTQVPGSSQIFNNHIPLDPVLDEAVALTKTAAKVNVTRGELVPYEITFSNELGVAFPTLTLVDTIPAGFSYVKGSAKLDGNQVAPTSVVDQVLTWANVGIGTTSQRRLVMLLAVGGGVREAEYVNQVQAFTDASATTPLSGIATATVRVVPDPTFDCTDVLGKVFDDGNRNGRQEKGERGIEGVRLITARGLAATTDRYGRFHIMCPIVPHEGRGSNFILKLDDRSLPTGFRLSTPQTQVKRATRGKALRFTFGASIHRVVSLDMADPVFEPESTEIRPQWKPRIGTLLDELAKAPALLRVSYLADVEPEGLVDRRVSAVKKLIEESWKDRDGYPLTIETEIFWRRGSPLDDGAVRHWQRSDGELPPVSAGPPETALPPVSAPPPDTEVVAETITGAQFDERTPDENVERHLSTNPPFTQWTQDADRVETDVEDQVQQREVVAEVAETVKLQGVVPPIRFESGVADIPSSYVERLRSVLREMENLHNVRLHLIGHADNQPLSGALAARYGDNAGLSRERAGEVAEFLQTALGLPPEAISYEWAGDTQPVASNATAAGRAQNRRVEVEVWYDELEDTIEIEEYVVEQDVKRVKVCRVETVCKLRYRKGHEHRARVRNLVPPLLVEDDTVGVPAEFTEQIRQALYNMRDRENVTVKFVGFTDDVPLTGRDQRIYGTHLSLSKARAHRVALAVREALDLPTSGVASDGKGAAQPVASNDTPRGRALNRRIEVEFWYDDVLQELPDEPQLCPDAAGADTVTRVYDPPWGRIEALPVENGSATIPPGFGAVLRRAMADVADETNVRLRFIGYTSNERLDRRTALVYGDDIGLSASRARRTMEAVQADLGLSDAQVEHEGHGYVHSNDVVNAGFIQGDRSYVVVQVVYDELALLDDYEGVDVTPMTRELSPKDPLELNLMRISVDGKPLDDPARSSADIQRCTDVALDRANVQFRFDDLESDVRLSVTAHPTTVPVPASANEGPPAVVRFQAYSNYPHFIARKEIRVFDIEQSVDTDPLAVVPVPDEGLAEWQLEPERFASPVRSMKFVLRVYDAEGRFDETAPQQLWLVHRNASDPQPDAAPDAQKLLAGYGEAEPVRRNIPLDNAGTVKVQGRGIPPQHSVWFAGEPVPVDEHGTFVAEAIVPTGTHTVEVAVLDDSGSGELFLRDLELKRDDWFFVGMADMTLSESHATGKKNKLKGRKPAEDSSLADGRIAFFLKGKFAEDLELTAAADTREEEVQDLFTNFLDKSPDALFRRLDPDYYYPTYGDDSTVEQLAPTSGKLYVKLSKDENQALWGNFDVGYLDNELAQVDRGLYGANVHYQTLGTTNLGQQRAMVDGYAAQPGTVSSREEFRGTDGSLYYLRHQDLLIGSERVRIEVRDKVSGIVTNVVHLRPSADYDIDYLQGRVLLSRPLEATVPDGLLVRSQGLSGNEAYLVVQYEYSPTFNDIDAMTFGGQGHWWLNDHVKLGVTASQNEQGGASTLYGGQMIVQQTADSWVKFQAGRSEGQVSSTQFSQDGGFNFVGTDNLFRKDEAEAYRADLAVAFRDLFARAGGRLTVYAQRLGQGYSAPGQQALTDTDTYGGTLEVPLTNALELTAKADREDQDNALKTTTAEVDGKWQVTEGWSIGAGGRYEDRDDDFPIFLQTQETGERGDAVVQIGFDSQAAWRTYAFGQGTLWKTGNRESNERGGVGGAYLVSDKLALEGEASHGNTGPAVKLGTRFQEPDGTQRYINYALENERGANGVHAQRGTLISGAKSRLGDSGSVYMEDRYQHAGSSNGLTRAMGMTLSPSDRWSFGGSWELGTLIDQQTQAETKRRAGGGSVGYSTEDLKFSSGIEYRYDKTQDPLTGSWSHRTTWLFRNSGKLQATPSVRLLGKYNHSFSDSSLGQFFDGGYREGILGVGFRPVDHDRFDALAKYTYFYNMPTTDQVVLRNTPVEYVQRSHIASLDMTYDITSWFALGAKYGYRRGEVSTDRVNKKFFDNDAHLYILRGDVRFLKMWEGSVEGRMLYLPDLDDQRKTGALVTLYRYLGENFKIGVGYNFTDFSDDLTDLSYDDHGVFLNLVGSL